MINFLGILYKPDAGSLEAGFGCSCSAKNSQNSTISWGILSKAESGPMLEVWKQALVVHVSQNSIFWGILSIAEPGHPTELSSVARV